MRVGSPGFNGERLVEARELRGISATALALLVGVTPASISQYQKGVTTPSPSVLSGIASKLGFPEGFFFLPDVEARTTATFFRSKASNTKAARLAAEWKMRALVRMMDYLTSYLDVPEYRFVDAPERDPLAITHGDIEDAATALRRAWSIGDGAIGDLTLLAENHGFVISRHPLYEDREDALSKPLLDGERDYVLVNADLSVAVHARFSLAHELGHMVLHRHLTEDERLAHHKTLEKQANRFAGALLLPSATFPRDFVAPDVDVFVRLKRKWKVSASAMVMRASALGIISPRQKKSMQVTIRRRGWHRGEPLDQELVPEEPRLLRRSFGALLDSGLQSRRDVVTALPYPAEEVERMAGLAPGTLDPARTPPALPRVRVRGDVAEGAHATVYSLSEAAEGGTHRRGA